MSLINKEVSEFSVQAFQDNAFKTVTKADILGKWSVFFFYPADFTFVCPTELEDLAEKYEDFKSIGRTVVIEETTLSFFCSPNATTVTSSRFSSVGFKRTFNLSFPLISTTFVSYPMKDTRNTSSDLAAIA